MKENIKFKIQLNNVLEVLCSQIYDSPLALLRENVQNAYDAVLMRKHKGEEEESYQPRIDIKVGTSQLIICDNGIGMNSESLKENFWTAGSSGKNNPEARDAGVVGTFGIGAMANFGVCSELKVISKPFGNSVTYTSYVKKSNLSLDDDCIHISDDLDSRSDFGTTIIATLDTGMSISETEACEYLSPYVRFIPFPVFLNEKLISQEPIEITDGGDKIIVSQGEFKDHMISFKYKLSFNSFSNVSPQILITDISLYGIAQEGVICLKASDPILYGLRNYFGLAPIPASSVFGFGGVVNMSSLTPTAGREAVSRESINIVAAVIRKADEVVARAIAAYDIADQCRELLIYIRQTKSYDLTNNIQISICGREERMKLGSVAPVVGGKAVNFYEGKDKQIQNNHSDEKHILLIPADDSVRRQIQIAVLKIKGIESVPDSVEIQPLAAADLSVPEISIATKIKTVLAEDYLMNDATVRFAKISHNLTSNVQDGMGGVTIYLSKESSDIDYLKRIYNDNFPLFEPLIKDYVRTKLYPKFSQYVPSSTRDGAEALYNILQRKRELYTIEYSELGEMESVMKDYLDGKIPYKEVLKAATTIKNKQTQMVSAQQIGDINLVLPSSLPTAHVLRPNAKGDAEAILEALPPILRRDIDTKYKILHTVDQGHSVSGYNTFLSLSDRMFREYYEFFLQPHTTRIIWSIHKIIYIFTHASSNLTLYYDIDLIKKLDRDATGGRMIMSSTIVTKNHIFIPVIPEMDDYFNIRSGQLKFSVRFDSVCQGE